jgi:hypothetical protein
MPTYSIIRSVPGATAEDIDSASMRAIWCLPEFPGMQWVQSYWDRDAEVINCIYVAPNEEMIRQHAVNSRIPCDEVTPVVAFGPDNFLSSDAIASDASPLASLGVSNR